VGGTRERRCEIEPAVITALIASLTSVVVAIATAVLSRNAQRKAQQAKAEDDKKLEQLRNALGEAASERDARRDYEYEARKHLYQVTEPLLFVLSERAVDLLDRIKGLARTARNGDLEPGDGWLTGDGYYIRSTVHRLVSPVAIFNLLQDSLTMVDLDLDRETRRQFELLRLLAWAMTDHYSFAKCDPLIPYNPDADSRKAKRDPAQGLPSGWVETAGESVIVNQEGGKQRVMRFGEFNESYSIDDNSVYKNCSPVATLLYDFHPRTHPVLWRCLITQAHICTALTSARHGSERATPGGGGHRVDAWDAIPAQARADYDWRQPGESVDDALVLVEPFEASRAYLEKRLRSVP
jgi:hypothetical protein